MFGPRFFSTHLDSSKMLPHRVIVSAMARSCFAKIVSLSTADRLPARTRVEATSTPSFAGRVHKFDLLAEQQRLGCVCASAASVLAHERARSDGLAVGALLVAPQSVCALFSCRAHESMAGTQALALKVRQWRYGEGRFLLGYCILYTVMRLQQFLTSRC